MEKLQDAEIPATELWVKHQPWMDEAKLMFSGRKTATEAILEEESKRRAEMIRSKLAQLEYLSGNLAEQIGFLQGFFGIPFKPAKERSQPMTTDQIKAIIETQIKILAEVNEKLKSVNDVNPNLMLQLRENAMCILNMAVNLYEFETRPKFGKD